MNKRLLEEGINEIIMFFDEKNLKTLTRKKAKIDFTSLRDSRLMSILIIIHIVNV